MTEEHNFWCAVANCDAVPAIVEQDEQWTVVECAEHQARTRWDTTVRVVGPPQIMELGWKNYLTARRP